MASISRNAAGGTLQVISNAINALEQAKGANTVTEAVHAEATNLMANLKGLQGLTQNQEAIRKGLKDRLSKLQIGTCERAGQWIVWGARKTANAALAVLPGLALAAAGYAYRNPAVFAAVVQTAANVTNTTAPGIFSKP